ncbi:hypothetical protein GCM10023322_65430 [Rugosimonospora acidiphila]|uniref:Uncharacterized protein n=1 Tax=Rugosimonospora acidiphila TaxID=556531 RepID=A0ABP9SJR3_9ACTN
MHHLLLGALVHREEPHQIRESVPFGRALSVPHRREKLLDPVVLLEQEIDDVLLRGGGHDSSTDR